MGLFFAFGCAMSGLTIVLLSFPGTSLDALWGINPAARAGFQRMGAWAIILMVAVCGSCGVASVGLWSSRRWGYRMALIVLVVNVIGDTLNFVLMHDPRTLIGLPIGGAMIAYLVRQRSQFNRF
jgi:hypothetical protein